MLVLGYNDDGWTGNADTTTAQLNHQLVHSRVHIPLRPPELTQFHGTVGKDYGATAGSLLYQIPSVDRTVVHGAGVNQGPHLMVGEVLSFKVHCFTKEGGICNPIAPGTLVECKLEPFSLATAIHGSLKPKVIDLNNGQFEVRYTVLTPGKYNVWVSLDGARLQTMKKNTFEFFPGKAFPGNCEVEGPGVYNFDFDQPASFLILAHDEYGNACKRGGDRFGVRGLGNVTVNEVVDRADGTYGVTYTVNRPNYLQSPDGTYKMSRSDIEALYMTDNLCTLEVLLLGKPIKRSPLRPLLHPEFWRQYEEKGVQSFMGAGEVKKRKAAWQVDHDSKESSAFAGGGSGGSGDRGGPKSTAVLTKQLDELAPIPPVPNITPIDKGTIKQYEALMRSLNMPGDGGGGDFGTEMSFLAAEEWARLAEQRMELKKYRDQLIEHQEQLKDLGLTVEDDCNRRNQQQQQIRKEKLDLIKLQDRLDGLQKEMHGFFATDPRVAGKYEEIRKEHVLAEKEKFIKERLAQISEIENIQYGREKQFGRYYSHFRGQDAKGVIKQTSSPGRMMADNDPENLSIPKLGGDLQRAMRMGGGFGNGRERAQYDLNSKQREFRFAQDRLEHMNAVKGSTLQHLNNVAVVDNNSGGLANGYMDLAYDPVTGEYVRKGPMSPNHQVLQYGEGDPFVYKDSVHPRHPTSGGTFAVENTILRNHGDFMNGNDLIHHLSPEKGRFGGMMGLTASSPAKMYRSGMHDNLKREQDFRGDILGGTTHAWDEHLQGYQIRGMEGATPGISRKGAKPVVRGFQVADYFGPSASRFDQEDVYSMQDKQSIVAKANKGDRVGMYQYYKTRTPYYDPNDPNSAGGKGDGSRFVYDRNFQDGGGAYGGFGGAAGGPMGGQFGQGGGTGGNTSDFRAQSTKQNNLSRLGRTMRKKLFRSETEWISTNFFFSLVFLKTLFAKIPCV